MEWRWPRLGGGYKSEGCCWTTRQGKTTRLIIGHNGKKRTPFPVWNQSLLQSLVIWSPSGGWGGLCSVVVFPLILLPIATQLLCSMYDTECIIIAHNSRSSCLSAATCGRWNGAGRLSTKLSSTQMLAVLPITVPMTVTRACGSFVKPYNNLFYV